MEISYWLSQDVHKVHKISYASVMSCTLTCTTYASQLAPWRYTVYLYVYLFVWNEKINQSRRQWANLFAFIIKFGSNHGTFWWEHQKFLAKTRIYPKGRRPQGERWVATLPLFRNSVCQNERVDMPLPLSLNLTLDLQDQYTKHNHNTNKCRNSLINRMLATSLDAWYFMRVFINLSRICK